MHVLASFLPAGQRIELRVPFACVQRLVFQSFYYNYNMLLLHIWIDCNIIFSADEALDECGTEAPCKHLVQLLQV